MKTSSNKLVADLKCDNCGGVPKSVHLTCWKDHHRSSQLKPCLNKMQCLYAGWQQSQLDAIWLANIEFQDFKLLLTIG